MRSFTKEFDPSVPLKGILKGLPIEYLVVRDTRLIVRYEGAVLRLDYELDGDRKVRQLGGRVLESPHRRVTDFDELVTRVFATLERAIGYTSGSSSRSPSERSTK